MKILEVLQCTHEYTCTYQAIKGLTFWRPLRYHSFGPTSPYSNLEKMISLALKILIVPPLLTICSALDLFIHVTIMPWVGCCNAGLTLEDYFTLLISILVRPIFATLVSLAGKSPEFVSSVNMNLHQQEYLGQPIYDHNQRYQRLYDNKELTIAHITCDILPSWPTPNAPLPIINYKIIKKLIAENKIDVNQPLNWYNNKDFNNPPCMLAEAIRRNDLKLTRLILKVDNGDLNRFRAPGVTLLSYFITNGPDEMDPKLLDYLLKKGLKLNPKGDLPFSMRAVMHGKFKFAKQLMKVEKTCHLKDLDQFEAWIDKINAAALQNFNDVHEKREYIQKALSEAYPNAKFHITLKPILQSLPKTNGSTSAKHFLLSELSVRHFFNGTDDTPTEWYASFKKRFAVEKQELLKLHKELIQAKGEVYLRIFDRHVSSQLPKEIWHKIAEFI